MHALVRFANIAASEGFRSIDIYSPALKALGANPAQYTLASFRYDLSKLRAKGLVEKIPHSRRYRLIGKGYSICLIFLKLFERIYAPLTAGILRPFRGDRKLTDKKRSILDRLYQRIVDDLDELLRAVGLKAAA
jgi:ribosomal protein S19E (S16A)